MQEEKNNKNKKENGQKKRRVNEQLKEWNEERQR